MASEDMISFIDKICSEIGPRLGTSSAEREAGNLIEREFAEYCDSTSQEEFECHPRAFLDFIWITIGFFVLAVLFYFFNPAVTGIFIVLGLMLFSAQQVFLAEIVDPLFPKRSSTNVIGKISATGTPKGTILLGAHHDSAYEFPLFCRLGKNAIIVINLTVYLALAGCLLALAKAVAIFLDMPNRSFLDFIAIPVLLLALILTILIAITLRSSKVVPGANDNLSGVAIIREAGKRIAQNRPANCNVWLVSFGCEECMRGSKRFAVKHQANLQGPYDMLLNFDSVGAEKLHIIKGEKMFRANHSPEVTDYAETAAKNAGYNIPSMVMKFAGTDAAAFSRRQLKAASIVAMDSHGMPKNWHSLDDQPDQLDGKVLDQAVDIAIEFVKAVDSSIREGRNSRNSVKSPLNPNESQPPERL
ncbi:MAG: M28 family metallopeptidase [Candidatus Hodarchaeota archaeon]